MTSSLILKPEKLNSSKSDKILYLRIFFLAKIISAKPTDGLWVDGRNDENQLGMSYEELEEAMVNPNSKYYKKYLKIRETNLHKMKEIPVCKFD